MLRLLSLKQGKELENLVSTILKEYNYLIRSDVKVFDNKVKFEKACAYAKKQKARKSA